jgi:hypothetical protein
MKLNARFTTHILQALAVGIALVSTAFAGCGDLSSPFPYAQAQAVPALRALAVVNPAANGAANPLSAASPVPATQNFCMGVWLRTGMFTYEVNHFALNYDATTGTLAAKINIRQQITLDPSGNQLSGTFTIDVYNPAGTQQEDHVAGTVAATRVTVDQTTP